jgi:hypothetical protein
MLIAQSDVFDVTVAQGTVLTVREANSYQRTFQFHNITVGSTISIVVEYSNDGGTTWADAVTTFNVLPGIISVQNVSAAFTGILRVRASGGGNDRDLIIGYSRVYDSTTLWTDPTL